MHAYYRRTLENLVLDLNMKWDVFISHASEDKNDIARPLASALSKRGMRVWFDEFTLVLGDSLRQSIDHGLRNSRFGIVILSPWFFKKDWPQKELDGLVSLERRSRKVILPIWHNVKYADVLKYSSILAGKLAVSSSVGLEKVVEELLKAISPRSQQMLDKTNPQSLNSFVSDRQTINRVDLTYDASDATGKMCVFRHTDSGISSVYLRIAATNKSSFHLKNVLADLVGLRYRSSNSEKWTPISLEPHHLNWAFSHGSPCDSLEPNTTKYIDLVTFRDDLDGIDIMVARPKGERFYWQSSLNRIGQYLFDVRVFPENCERTENSFILNWNGSIEQFQPTDLTIGDDMRGLINE